MSHSALSQEQFSGVLHGYDEDGNKVTAPYMVEERHQSLSYARRLRESGINVTEHSHEGSCKSAGCTF